MPVCLHKISSDYSNLCFKCKQERGTYMHCFWSCDKIQFYWKGIHHELEKILKIRMVFSPAMFLLNLVLANLAIANVLS
uniref:Uncharacterized protein n=1 Tax=Pygocentrus nattereri TaxID=42514 RepID=A0AAR2LEN7_PYGNA